MCTMWPICHILPPFAANSWGPQITSVTLCAQSATKSINMSCGICIVCYTSEAIAAVLPHGPNVPQIVPENPGKLEKLSRGPCACLWLATSLKEVCWGPQPHWTSGQYHLWGTAHPHWTPQQRNIARLKHRTHISRGCSFEQVSTLSDLSHKAIQSQPCIYRWN